MIMKASDITERFKALTHREALFAAIAAVAIVVAIFCGSLYAGAYVPGDAAAKVNDSFMPESRVAAWIDQYRSANALTDDGAFASALLSENKNVATFRQEAVNQLALDDLVNERAKELGVEPTDAEAREQLDALKQRLAFGDDGVWADTIASYGLSDEALIEQYKTNLARAAVLDADVPRRDATDGELLAYMKGVLAGTTQKHAYRIVFEGDDAYQRAQECHARLVEKAEGGALSLEAFSEEAKASSDEEGAAVSGGSYAWSGGAMDGITKELIANMSVGSYTEPESDESSGAVVIVYCDDSYEFPTYSSLDSIPADVPDELMNEIRQAASDAAWTEDCNSYLAKLISEARITYYPVPSDAAYNIVL